MRQGCTLTQVAVDVARVGEEIRAERERQGLSQAELARRAGTHQAVISKIEQGIHELRVELLGSIADALGGAEGLGVILLRAGAIGLDFPVAELLAADPKLSADSRDLMRRTYDRLAQIDAG